MEWIKDSLKDVVKILLVVAIGLPLGFLILSLAYMTPLGPNLHGFVAYLSNFNEMIVTIGLMVFVIIVGFVGFTLVNAIVLHTNLLIKRKKAPPEEVKPQTRENE